MSDTDLSLWSCEVCGEPVFGRDFVMVEKWRFVLAGDPGPDPINDNLQHVVGRECEDEDAVDGYYHRECIALAIEMMFVEWHKRVASEDA